MNTGSLLVLSVNTADLLLTGINVVTAAQLLSPTSAVGEAFATSVLLTGVNKIGGSYGLSVVDSAANLSNVNLDGIQKQDLTVVVTGMSTGDTMDLTNIHAPAVVDLRGNTASVPAGLNTPTLAFIGLPDVVVLGSTAASVNYTRAPSGGLELISNDNRWLMTSTTL